CVRHGYYGSSFDYW
nr:immunoglobulin heavy chain junction region [Mus musculus]